MTKVFAHMGYRAEFPENTLLAFREAIKTGCHGIELDVQLSKDGVPVLIHDEDVGRTTNGSGLIQDLTFSELRTLDAGLGEQIPTLSEYFDLVKNLPLITNIELKNSVVAYEGLEERVLKSVRSYGLSDRIIFSSFRHESVRTIKRLAPDIPCGYLCHGPVDVETLAASMRESGVEFIHPCIQDVDDCFLETVHKYEIPMIVWTVNQEAELRKLVGTRVHAVITDQPALLMRFVTEPLDPGAAEHYRDC